MKKFKFLILIFCCTFIFSSCLEKKDKSEVAWDRIIKSGSHTTVNIAYDSDKDFDLWINENLAEKTSAEYSINLNLDKVEIDRINTDVVLDEEGEAIKGDYDIIIIKAKDFKKLNSKNFLYGPFSNKLPNFNKSINSKDFGNTYINLDSLDGKAICFYENQLSYFYNADLMYEQPRNLEELKTYIKENKGSFLYPSPRITEGKLFVESVILSFEDEEKFMDKGLNREQVKKLASKGLKYLKEINPYLYGGGRTFPQNMEDMDKLFLDGKIHSSFSLNQFHADNKSAEFLYPDYTRPFMPIETSVSDNQYYAIIPYNSANKSGAMLVLDEFLSEKVQISLYKDKNLYGTIVYSPDVLDKKMEQRLNKAVKKKTVTKAVDLLKRKKGSIPEEYWPYILEEWEKIN